MPNWTAYELPRGMTVLDTAMIDACDLERIAYKPDAGRSWELILPSMRYGLWSYITRGVPAGGFLQALLSNDLKETFSRADDDNGRVVRDYMKFLWGWGPAGCWGGPERYRDWLAQGGLAGIGVQVGAALQPTENGDEA